MRKWMVWIALLAAALLITAVLLLRAGLLLWRIPGGEATTRLIVAPQGSQAGSDTAGIQPCIGSASAPISA